MLLILYGDNVQSELGRDWIKILKHQHLKICAMDRPVSPISVLINAQKLVRTIQRFDPDVVHYQEDPRDELMLALFYFRSIPTVLTIHDPINHSGADSERLRYSRFRFYRPILRRTADVAIVHGNLLSNILVKEIPSFLGRVTSIPHGPLGNFASIPAISTGNIFRLLFFGRLHKYKGLSYFVNAVIALRNKGYPVIGVVAGRGSDLEPNRIRMEESGCFEILNRYIANDEIPGLFLGSFAVILPYVDGTQSGVAAMALGFSRPVVASSVGSIPELVREGENGLLVPPGNTEALIAAIEALFVNKELWEKLVMGAIKLRNNELSWDTIADRTMDVYERVSRLRISSG